MRHVACAMWPVRCHVAMWPRGLCHVASHPAGMLFPPQACHVAMWPRGLRVPCLRHSRLDTAHQVKTMQSNLDKVQGRLAEGNNSKVRPAPPRPPRPDPTRPTRPPPSSTAAGGAAAAILQAGRQGAQVLQACQGLPARVRAQRAGQLTSPRARSTLAHLWLGQGLLCTKVSK